LLQLLKNNTTKFSDYSNVFAQMFYTYDIASKKILKLDMDDKLKIIALKWMKLGDFKRYK
jgi:hypothetical protein